MRKNNPTPSKKPIQPGNLHPQLSDVPSLAHQVPLTSESWRRGITLQPEPHSNQSTTGGQRDGFATSGRALWPLAMIKVGRNSSVKVQTQFKTSWAILLEGWWKGNPWGAISYPSTLSNHNSRAGSFVLEGKAMFGFKWFKKVWGQDPGEEKW